MKNNDDQIKELEIKKDLKIKELSSVRDNYNQVTFLILQDINNINKKIREIQNENG